MHQPERTLKEGGVGCTVGDYDNDGWLDLFVATYGTTLLYRNLGDGKFREVAAEAGVQRHLHAVGASWGDVDNDGDLDLFVAAYVDGDEWYSRDHLFMNQGGRFVDVLEEDSALHASDHGVQWADFDRDGDLDLSLTETFRSTAATGCSGTSCRAMARRARCRCGSWIARGPRDARGRRSATVSRPTARLLGTRLVPTGDGYGSQGVVPVHFGLADSRRSRSR